MKPSLSSPAGMKWIKKESGMPGYSSSDGSFDILIGKGYVVLVAFDHDPVDDAEFWRKRFATIEQAMDHADKM